VKFLDSRRLGWDTETTGTNPVTARIVTAALVGRGGPSEQRVQTWLVNPGVPIPPESTAIHGISDAKAQAEGQNPKIALQEIAETMARAISYGMPLVAFNTAYDWSVLHHELVRHGLRTMADRIGGEPYTLVDPMVLDKQADKYRKGSRKLKDVSNHYCVRLTDWHTAEADALAALGIAEALYERNPRLDGYDPKRLFLAQQAWREEQCTSYQAYLRKTNPNATVDGTWPLVPAEGVS
jgi:DNA polymerase III subunit epsilon